MPPGIGAVLIKIAINIAISLVLSFVAKALAPKPPGRPDAPTRRLKDRVFETQDPVAPREIVYGVQRKSGNRVFIESTNDNKFLHTVIVLAAHQIEAIDEVFINDDPIHADDLDGNGLANAGKYSGKVRIKKLLGTGGQTADADLVSEVSGWTTNHRLRGIAYLYVRLEFDQDLFPGSVPNVSAWIRGKRVLETRDSALPTQFTLNPTLILRDYLVTDTDDMGMGFDAANEIDDDFIDSAANVCDEFVTTTDLGKIVANVNTGSDFVDFASDLLLIYQLGDKVDVTSTGSVPAGLGTGLFAIPYRRAQAILADDTVHANVSMQFASTHDNALAGTAIDITTTGSGTITVTKKAEPRYSASGIISSDEEPIDSIENILSSMAGTAVHVGGLWKIYAGEFITPTLAIDENDLRGPMVVQTKHSRRERFNAVKGVYTSPINNGVTSEYPPVTNSLYKSEDNNIRLWRDFDLEFVTRAHQAQRLAKILLEKHRQQIRIEYPAMFTAFQLQPMDTVQVTNARMGWTDKEFEVAEVTIVPGESEGGDDAPSLAIDLILVETASGVYDWASGEETLVDLAPNTNFPNPLIVGAPTGLSVTTEQFTDPISNAVNSVLLLDWTTPTDFFVLQDGKIEIQFKRSSAVAFTGHFFVPGGETAATIRQVQDEVAYDIRIRSVNHLGVRSNFSTVSAYIVGSSFDPSVGHLDRRFVTETPTFDDWGNVTDTPDSPDFIDYGDIV